MPLRKLVSRDLHRMALGERALDYVLVRRRGRRGVGFKVDESGLTVSAPATMPLAKIESLVRESERWIVRKVAEWRTRQVPSVCWRDGERLPFLGGGLELRLTAGARAAAQRQESELHVVSATGQSDDIRRIVVAWYKRQARSHLEQRVAERADAAGIARPRFFLSSALARWGSCNSRREVRLAWRLIKAPAEMIDYVVCHELAHLRHMDHSAAFWAEVERQCPDYRALRQRLFAADHTFRSF